MVLDGVMRLSTELSMTQDPKPGGYNLANLMGPLVKCLKMEGIPDIKRAHFL